MTATLLMEAEAPPALPWFSTSEEVAFKSCRLRHHMAYDLGYRPRFTPRRLSVGSGTHLALESYYRDDNYRDALDAWASLRWAEIQAADLGNDAEVAKTFEADQRLIALMVEGYIEWVEAEGLDADWETVAVEEGLWTQVPGAPCILPAKLDLLQRRRSASERLRIVDWKTRSSFGAETGAYHAYLLAEQTGNYALAVLANYGGSIPEVVYRELRKVGRGPRAKPPFYREFRVRLTPAELSWRATQYIRTAEERFDPDRKITANPTGCCSSWRADSWTTPCLMIANGAEIEEALQASPQFSRDADPYRRYNDDTEGGE